MSSGKARGLFHSSFQGRRRSQELALVPSTCQEIEVAEGNKAREKEFKADQQKPLDTPRTREAVNREP